MLDIQSVSPAAERQTAPRGQTLLRRTQAPPWVGFLESGRVVLGVMVGDVMEHQLGVLEGPCWLEASSAVVLRRVPMVMTKPLFSSAKNLAQQSD